MSDTVWVGGTTAFATNGNWLGGTAPGNGDTATLDGRAVNAIAGSNESARTLATLTQSAKMAYTCGTSGAMLQIGATNCILGLPPGDGSSAVPAEIALNFGSAQTTIVVYSSAAQGTSGLAPVLIKGLHASNKITVIGGI